MLRLAMKLTENEINGDSRRNWPPLKQTKIGKTLKAYFPTKKQTKFFDKPACLSICKSQPKELQISMPKNIPI